MTRSRLLQIPLVLAATAVLGCAGTGRAPSVRPAPGPSRDAGVAAGDTLRVRAAVLRAEDRRVLDDSVRAAAGHPDAGVRAAAARALGRIGDPAGVDALVALTSDDDAGVRSEALFALAILDPAAARGPVLDGMDADDPTVRARATRLAARVAGEDAVDPLIGRLTDDESSVVVAACYALAEATGAAAAVDTLLALTHEPDPRVGGAAIWTLARFGERRDAVDAETRNRVRATLREVARAPQPVARMLAARGLAIPGHSDDAEVLGALVRDRQPVVRIEAIRSLSFPGAPLEPFLKPVLADENPHVVLAAVEGLGRMRGPEIIDALANIIVYDQREWLRVAAVRALGTADPTQAAQIANGLSRDASATIRRESARLLDGQVEGEALDNARRLAEDPDEAVRLAAIPALGGSPEPLDEVLADALASDDPRALSAAARAAGWRLELAGYADVDSASAWRVLRTVLERADAPEDGAVAGEVVAAATRAGAVDETRDLLHAALDHPAWEPRRRAVAALATLFDETADPGPATERPLEDYVEILRWAERPRAAIVTIERPGFTPGRFTLRLDTERAPLAARRFALAAESGELRGLPFDRLVPNRRLATDDVGAGGWRAERTPHEYLPGMVLAADTGPDMVGGGFEVLTIAQPHLTGRDTAFGQVVLNLPGVVGLALPQDRIVRVAVYEGDGSEPLPPLDR